MVNRAVLQLLPLLALALAASGQDAVLDLQRAFRVSLPEGGPVALENADWAASKARVRGGAMVVDLRSTLQLKNSGLRRIRGLTLLVLAQEATPGGKASVTVPSLDIAPGELFPVRIDLRLMRPLAQGGAALAEVALDGVLFDDLTFFGPNRLNSRRAMLAWELEARRDRKALLSLLQQDGPERVREEMLVALSHQAGQSQMRVARSGRATNMAPAQSVPVAFLALPDAPVELLSGWMDVAGNEARSPRVEVRNASRKAVRFLEVAWLVEDAGGRRYPAGTLPSELRLPPGGKTELGRDVAMRFTRPGGAAAPIGALSGYLSSVEFEDGEVWVPAAAVLAEARRKGLLPASGELYRLAELYRRRGLEQLLTELRRLR